MQKLDRIHSTEAMIGRCFENIKALDLPFNGRRAVMNNAAGEIKYINSKNSV